MAKEDPASEQTGSPRAAITHMPPGLREIWRRRLRSPQSHSPRVVNPHPQQQSEAVAVEDANFPSVLSGSGRPSPEAISAAAVAAQGSQAPRLPTQNEFDDRRETHGRRHRHDLRRARTFQGRIRPEDRLEAVEVGAVGSHNGAVHTEMYQSPYATMRQHGRRSHRYQAAELWHRASQRAAGAAPAHADMNTTITPVPAVDTQQIPFDWRASGTSNHPMPPVHSLSPDPPRLPRLPRLRTHRLDHSVAPMTPLSLDPDQSYESTTSGEGLRLQDVREPNPGHPGAVRLPSISRRLLPRGREPDISQEVQQSQGIESSRHAPGAHPSAVPTDPGNDVRRVGQQSHRFMRSHRTPGPLPQAISRVRDPPIAVGDTQQMHRAISDRLSSTRPPASVLHTPEPQLRGDTRPYNGLVSSRHAPNLPPPSLTYDPPAQDAPALHNVVYRERIAAIPRQATAARGRAEAQRNEADAQTWPAQIEEGPPAPPAGQMDGQAAIGTHMAAATQSEGTRGNPEVRWQQVNRTRRVNDRIQRWRDEVLEHQLVVSENERAPRGG